MTKSAPTKKPAPSSKPPVSAGGKKKVIWKNLGPRALSAVIFALICLVPLYIGGYVWGLFVLLLGLRLVWEWVNMSDMGRSRLALIIPMLGMIITIGYVAEGMFLNAVLAAAAAAVAAGAERWRRGGAHWAFLGTFYIFIPTALLAGFRGHEFGFSNGLGSLLFIILIVIGADTGAYFGGSMFKGPKMAPKLSPNKTWSGFVSGLIFGTFFGTIIGQIIGLGAAAAFFLALLIVISSVFGDFLESGLKRKFKVKDAGNLMPGHGGLLDRVDSLMMAITFSALVLLLFPSVWPGAL